MVFDPWRQETWDVNDTVLITDPSTDADVGDFFGRIPIADYLPTWHALRTQAVQAVAFAARYPDAMNRTNETRAAEKASVHAATPTVTHADSLGRTLLTVAHNKFKYSDMPAVDPPVEEFHSTRIILDIEGNQREVIDAKDRVVTRYDYDMVGNRVHQASMEAGERWMLNDVAGKPLYVWDSSGHSFRTAYDPLRRPTDSFLSEGAGARILVGQTIYGEGRLNPEASNLRGRVVEIHDQAGVVTSNEYDFKGNLLRSRRQLGRDYKTTLNWSGAVPLEAETYTSRTRYDALNRPTQLIAPHSDKTGAKVNVIQPGYNDANLLERVDVWLNGNAEPDNLLDPATANLHAVTNIDYDAKGQRELIAYGNGAVTAYNYDPLTFRLVYLLTRRNAADFPNDCPQPLPAGRPNCWVQNLHYSYDPAGNITHIRDDAQQAIYFRNTRVEPSAEYTYDAVYRLIEATGREHLGQVGGSPIPHSYNDAPRVGLLQPGDGNAMGRYLERYIYDDVGNFLLMQHRGSDPAHPGWNRTYAYNETSQLELGKQSNRLTSTTIGGTTETYSTLGDGYDAHGNMLHMPHLQVMRWDYMDQLQMTQRQLVHDENADGVLNQGERTWYVYDATGQRIRKVTDLAAGQVKDERIYLGGFEIYRKNGANPLVRETLHIMDDKQRIALVETRTLGNEPGMPTQLIRYQFGNHLGSASLELDDQAQVISYEEYTPYGSTSYQAVHAGLERKSKRYRYTGKERDEENGFTYHKARYYMPWLGRWTSCDPAELINGVNVLTYSLNNPIRFADPTGSQARDEELPTQVLDLARHVGIPTGESSGESRSFFDSIGDALSSIGSAISNLFSSAWDWIKGAATSAWNWTKGAVSTAWNWTKGAVSTAWDWIKSAATSAWNWTRRAVSTAWDWIKGAASTAWNWTRRAVSTLWEWTKSAASWTWNWVLAPAIRTATNTLAGAVVGGLPGAIAGFATGAFHGWSMASAHSYAWDSASGWAAFLVDNTWALPNSVVGSLFATANVIGGNPIDRNNSRGSNALMFENEWFSGYATTLGNVMVGTKGLPTDVLRHEQSHVLQSRIFGPVFYPSMIAHYAINTILPYWLFYHSKQYPNRPITSFGQYFTRGVYPHTWAEEWGYSIGGYPN
jgi:RHS repeat-associated protein